MEKQAEAGRGKPVVKTGMTDLWELEKQLHREGLQLICGVDEAGRGPLAGPVCAAAVILPQGFLPDGLNDSKKLSEKKREILFPQSGFIQCRVRDSRRNRARKHPAGDFSCHEPGHCRIESRAGVCAD